MKLVEILARELKEWLDCWVSAVQDSDGTVWFNLVDNVGPIFDADRSWVSNPCHSEMFNVSSDFQTAIVTRAQWEAERARIAELARGQDSLITVEEAEALRTGAKKPYEQELWDKAYFEAWTIGMKKYASSGTLETMEILPTGSAALADAFMAERSKRLKR